MKTQPIISTSKMVPMVVMLVVGDQEEEEAMLEWVLMMLLRKRYLERLSWVKVPISATHPHSSCSKNHKKFLLILSGAKCPWGYSETSLFIIFFCITLCSETVCLSWSPVPIFQ